MTVARSLFFFIALLLLPLSAHAATPAFSVHKNGTNQTVTQDTDVKLTWSTEGFDTNSNFATDRFTPTVAGKYLIVVSAQCMQSGACMPSIYKNGALVARAQSTNVNIGQTPQVTTIVDLNGSTDYVEAFINSAGSVIAGTADRTYFSGSQIDGGGTAAAAGIAGQIQFNDGGNLQADAGLHWDNTNKRLGIGTAMPITPLHMDVGSTGGIGRLQISDSSATDGYMGIGEGGSAANTFFPLFIARPSNATGFVGYYSEVTTANDTGSVPVSVFVARQSPTAAVATRPLFDWRNNATSMMTMLANGNVGIGVSAPGEKLHVVGSLRLQSNTTDAAVKTSYVVGGHYTNAEEAFGIVGGIGGNGFNSVLIGSTGGAYNAATAIQFFTAANNTTLTGTERVRIDPDGNVGIGTTAPLARFNVAASGNGGFAINDTYAASGWYGTVGLGMNAARNASNNWTFLSDSANNGGALIDADIGGNLRFFTRDGAGGTTTANLTDAQMLALRRMTLNSVGNLGIGTTTPAGKLTLANNVGDGVLDTYGEYQVILYDGGSAVASYGLGVKANNLVFKSASAFAFHGGAGTSIATINTSGTYAASDRNLKQDIADLRYGLDAVMQLKPASYHLKEDPNGPRHIVFIAQEVKQVVPEVVIGEEGSMQLAYPSLVPVLTNAIQELKADNDNLRAELRDTINAQDAEIEHLRRELKTLQAAR